MGAFDNLAIPENADLSKLSSAELKRLVDILSEIDRRQSGRQLDRYMPYPKQAEFHSARAREVLCMAANQTGKTWAAAMHLAIHLTGQYPDWWTGRRWSRPIRAICGSESAELTRKGLQRLLVGPPESEKDWGTGAIPRDCLVGTTRRQGVANALDTVSVKHRTGGTSVLQFASYDQGRGKWQADTVDIVELDEEPPEDVYFEALTRTNATGGQVIITFTPLRGMSSVVKRFVMDKWPGTEIIRMTIDDALHYSQEQREAIIASYPDHERDARARGIPSLGSGRVFPVAESTIVCDPFPIPSHWPQIIGVDFGWDHPSAAARLAWDRDADCVYLTHTHRAREQTPTLFAASVKPWGSWIPVAWPHDGLQHDKGSGIQLARQYKDAGLKMLPERATFEDGSNGVEAGIMAMLERMQSYRFKVFSTCQDWLEEFRLYHRKDGLLVKMDDDLISASRYATMMLRKAITKPSSDDRRSGSFAGSYAGY